MRVIIYRASILVVTMFVLASCATICGGSKYNANILVNGRPNAQIFHQGQAVGNGSASIKVNRRDANKFILTVKEQGCQDQTFRYTSRTFRGWALVGSILFLMAMEQVMGFSSLGAWV
jgi:hypothetical protein